MIDRYTTPAMKRLWSEVSRYRRFLDVEQAVAKIRHEDGDITDRAYNEIKSATIRIKDIKTREKTTRHDVVAFIESVTSVMDHGAKVFHYGLTSTDVVDSAMGLILKDANSLILQRIDTFAKVLKEKAYRYKDLVSIGRTHGIHAEPTVFGLKFALWSSDLARIRSRFLDAAHGVEHGKLSGAVGTHSVLSPDIERRVLGALGLHQPEIATQILQRDRHALYVTTLAILGSELDKIATEIRHLSRTEVGEVMEAFPAGQKGSSAMPHKRNPVLSENISGLARVMRGHATAALENIALWHERDISHSSAERIILEDQTTLAVFMLERMTRIIRNLVVFEDVVRGNVDKTYGAIHTQHVLGMLVGKGFSRTDAYTLVQKTAFEALERGIHMRTLLSDHDDVTSVCSSEDIARCFDVGHVKKHVDAIYSRVFKKSDKRD